MIRQSPKRTRDRQNGLNNLLQTASIREGSSLEVRRMNRLSARLVACLAILATSMVVVAQTPAPPVGNPPIQPGSGAPNVAAKRNLFNSMLKELDLTQDQKRQIRVINRKARQDAAALRAAPGDNASKLHQLKAIRVARRKAIKGILTPDQLSKLKALIAAAKGKAP